MGMNRRIVGIVAVTAVMAATLVPLGASTAQAAPVGNGFTLTVPDLKYILDQIKIASIGIMIYIIHRMYNIYRY